ncbi:APC amino acid permease [Cunninghamella echinulata]|nr:APC amino acid permease [Cunninghamella echinulata]
MPFIEKLTDEEIEARDAERLRQLGYKQELKRELSSVGNMGMALSVVCISSGLTSLFKYGLETGGPVVMVWGWVAVSLFTLPVALAMAEICSAYPTAGGLYFWAAQLSTPKYKAFASWMTGWYNLIGQFAVTAGIDFGLSLMLCSLINVGTDGAWTPTPGATVGIHVLICFSHALANSFGTKVMKHINTISTFWQVIAPLVIILTIALKAPTHQSADFVFGHFNNDSGWDNMPVYVVLTGLLQAQFTLTGYDSSAHIVEESKRGEISAPVGIVSAVIISAVVGFCFIIAFLFCIQDLTATITSQSGFPVMQILFDSCGRPVAIFLMVLLMVACWFCGFASVTANSRMIYAFSRDGAIPGSAYLHKIHEKTKTPLNAVWLSAFIAALLGLPSLGNTTAFSAITSVATISLYISYGIPIFCKLLNDTQFKRGPLHLGKFSKIIGSIAVLWIIFITILFVLPPVSPVTATSMNYACLAIGLVTLGAGGRFAIDARIWFKGPITNLDPEYGEKQTIEENKTEAEDGNTKNQ